MEFSIALSGSQDIEVEGDISAIINILCRVLGLERYFNLYRSRRISTKSNIISIPEEQQQEDQQQEE